MEILIVLIVLGLLFFLAFFVAIPLAIIKELQHRKCPSCLEKIKKKARVCRYCGRDMQLNLAPPYRRR